MAIITVLGSGIMASALSIPLTDNNHEVRLVGTHLDREIIDSIQDSGVHPDLELELPSSVQAFQLEELEQVIDDAEVVMSGVNSFGVEWAAEQLAPLLKPGQIVLSIAKGMGVTDEGDLRILPDVLADPVPEDVKDQLSWTAVVGPSIAGEVAVRRDTCVIFSGADQQALDRLAELFRTDRYHAWTSTDFIGTEVCAAMKNCYALGVGIATGVLETLEDADSQYRNHNFEAALFAQGAIEIEQMAKLVGSEATPHVLPSVGDMYVTSMGGRNVRVGRLLGTGMGFSQAEEELGHPTLEGAAAIGVVGAALEKLTERGVVEAEDYPLLRHLYQVVELEQPLDIPWSSFYGGER